MVYSHALRNALIPIVTIAGLQIGYLMGGAVVIEVVFNLPGLGRLVVHAIEQRDYPVIQGIVLFSAAVFLMSNLLVDVLYSYLTPVSDTAGNSLPKRDQARKRRIRTGAGSILVPP